MASGAAIFRLLADSVRFRLLRAQDRFNVTELTAILGVAQSGVSRHVADIGCSNRCSRAAA